jgi:prepilin-type N-terminal cleavage/methylation domain-containing protein
MLKYKSQKGFTIVELLIVIVVIGILAALVLNTFSGVQKRARDTQRQTDVNSISTQLEVYYNDNGGYPLAGTITTANLKGLDAGALQPPNSAAVAVNGVTGAPGAKPVNGGGDEVYAYWPKEADGSTTCAAAPCEKFTLYYWKEDGDTVQSKNSLN